MPNRVKTHAAKTAGLQRKYDAAKRRFLLTLQAIEDIRPATSPNGVRDFAIFHVANAGEGLKNLLHRMEHGFSATGEVEAFLQRFALDNSARDLTVNFIMAAIEAWSDVADKVLEYGD